MKKRIISAIIIILLCIPFLLKGGMTFTIGIWLLGILSLKEFLDAKETKKEIPYFIKFISYILLTLIIFGTRNASISNFTIDYRILSALFLSFLIPTVLYHDRKRYSINDAFYFIGGLLFLGVAFSLMIIMREEGLPIIFYLLLITTITDSYAYLTGRLIGKNKLLENISPNKTLEGFIGGTFMGVFVAGTFYHVVINPELSLWIVLFVTLFLSVIGQLGDLVFSAIKRYFGKKDFSNLIPGHGGILDRLDSIIFVVLAFMFFISIL